MAAPGASGKTGSTEGTFVGIEQGEHPRFLIKEKNGHEDLFIILRPDESVQPYLHNPGKLKGRPVKVYWVKKRIPEIDGPVTIVVRVE